MFTAAHRSGLSGSKSGESKSGESKSGESKPGGLSPSDNLDPVVSEKYLYDK